MPQAQTVTIAQALQSTQSGLTVQDTAANIAAALPNPALAARVSLFTLSGPASIGTAAADRLAALGLHFAAGFPITVQDSLAAMTAPANAAGLALASSRQIVDAAYNLLAAAPSAFAGISAVTLTGTPTLSAAQLVKLEALPGFTVASGSHFTLTDTLANAAPVLVAHPGWFAAASGVVVHLDGSQVSAGVAVALAALANGGKAVSFTPSATDTTLNVNAAAHDLATAAASLNRIGQLVGVHITVSNDGSAISAADAVALTTITGFAPAQHTLTVADTGAAISAAGAALFNHGYPQIAVISGVFTGIAAQLLDPTLRVMAGASVSMTGNPVLNAAQIQALANLPGFALTPGATLIVADTISHILAHTAAMAPATAIVLTDSETVTAAGLAALAQIAAAHPGHFNLAGHTLSVADSAANLAGLSGAAIALGGSFTLTGNGTVNAAQFASLRDAMHVVANGHSVVVADTAANLLGLSGSLALVSAAQLSGDATVSAAQAQALAAEPNFSTGGHVLTIADTASALLALPGAVQALAGQLMLAGSQSVTASQAVALAGLGASFSTGGASLTVTDSAANLLALPVGVSAIASGYALSGDATVSAAQFTALYSPLHVALSGHVLTVLDTPANLLSIPGQAFGEGSFVLSAGGTVSAAQFAVLRDGMDVAANGNSLTVADSAANLLGLSGNLALVGATQLSADANVTAAQAQALAADPGFGTAGHLLSITDTAANLLALPGGVASLSGHLVLAGDQDVSAAQAAGLLALGSAFATGGHALVVNDTAAALLGLPAGIGAIATGYALSADATVSASGFSVLAGGLAVALDGHALVVSDTPANLLALPPQWLSHATGFSLSAGGTVSEAQFATLRDSLGVAANGHTLTVADTAADLLALSGDLSLDGATQMTAAASVTAAQAASLVNDPNFSTGGHVLTVTDTAAALLDISPAISAVAGAYALSADATVSAAQFLTLTATLGVSLNGHGLTIADTPANLLGLSGQALSQASGLMLSAGGTVTEAQFLTLRDSLGVNGNGHTLAVADNAANLLALSGNLALVGTATLSGAATVTAAQAVALAALPGFSTGGQVLTVTDNAANLLALPAGVQAMSGHLDLAASQSVSAAQAVALAALGGAFSTNAHVLTVTDTAAALLGLPAGAAALAGAYALSADATVSAAQFAALTGGLNVGLNGHALSVLDTPANLLALPAQSLGQATAFGLSAGGTVTEAQFTTLRDVLGVAGNGNILTVADNAANLLALSGNLALAGATRLSVDATVTAAQAQALAALPGFGTGGHVLTVADSAANLLGLPAGVQALSGHLVLAAAQTVSAAQITALAGLGAAFSAGGHTLTVSDTAANMLALPAGAAALAGAYTLSADATVNVAQFTALTGTLLVGLGGHALVVSDTPANLAGVPAQALGQATGFTLSASGMVSESQFVFLRDTMGVAGNGHTVTVLDSAADLLALGGTLSLVGATQLSGDATVTAAQAQALAGEPGFGLGGHVLTITDSAANLLALTTNLQTLSGHLVLAASQGVSAAQITALAALGAAFSAGGNTLTVSDNAANLLSLPAGAAALAGAYALSADASVTVAQFTTLTGTLHVGLGGHALVVSDTPAALLGVATPQIALATGFSLASGGTVSASQFTWLRDTLGVAGNGHTLSVADSAANLLALGGSLALAGSTLLTGNATVTAAQAQTLAGDPGFSTNGHVLSVSDSAANLLALPTGVQLLSGQLVLAGSQSVSAVQAAGLAALGGAFSTGGNTLTVTDMAANLLSLPAGVAAIAGAYALSADATVNAAGFATLYGTLHVALNGHAITVADTPANLLGVPAQAIPEASFTLTAGGTVSEAQFVALRDTFGVNANGHTLTVSDSAADLLALSGNLALDGATQLNADATVSAAQAVLLAAEPGFSVAGHVLTITDTAANLLALSTPVQTLSAHLVLSASQSVTAAQATALAALGGIFSTGGNTLTVTDTAANLLALPAGVAAIAGAYALGADATVTAAQFAGLRDSLHIALNGHAISIVDTAADLAGLTGSMADASAVTLSASGTVNAAAAAVLNADPGFSTAGHTLTIADSVANLLALGTPLQNLANGFSLSSNQVATAAQLAGLAAYGIKFSTGGYTLGVADNAASLASLSAPELALVGAATMTQSATVSAATASLLAGLPGFALGGGVVMTVQDSAANLLALPGPVLAIAGTEILPAGAVTLSAAQAAGLDALAHFSTAGASITVLDSVAALSGNAGWSAVATFTHVVDTAATLAANAASVLLQNATSVSLLGNATVSAAQAAALATIGGYATGSNTLTVADGAAPIAQNAVAINAVATLAVVNTTAPVTAAQADWLAVLSNGGKLSFQAGDTLTVADSYAALTASGNATGLALASNIVVTDTAANLVTAAAYNWGNVVPSYVLAANATITGAQATALAGLGSHLVMNGHTLAVQDSAANVVGNAAALTSLGISASVSDTAASIGGQVSNLQALGARLAAVQVTDASPLSPAVAAALAPLAGKLSGSAIAVAGGAASIDANVSALHTLGAHVAIALTDSAAAVGADAADLASLGAALTISLSDVGAVSAAVAAGLGTLTARLAGGTSLAVTDTVADVVAQAATLAAMGSAIGTLTLTGGTAVTVAQAVALLPLQSHLGTGVQLAVSGSAAAISSNVSYLLALQSNGLLASVTDSGESASVVLAAAGALNALGATVDVSDTLANFNASVASLAGLTGLAAITITDTVSPVFSLSLSQYAAEAAVLRLVTNTHTVAISDTAAAIEADLIAANSILLGITAPLTLAVSGGAPLVLSQAVAIQPAIGAVLADFSGTLQVTGATAAHLAAVAALSPSAISVSDGTAAIGSDLASGNSQILAHIAAISAIAATGGGSISLTAGQALAAGVDDGAGSVFGKLTGAGLAVTGATVAQVATLLAATVVPGTITVSDSAANITAALIDPASAILNSANIVQTLTVSDAGTITLTEAQDVAQGVNDGPHAALTKIAGGAIDIMGVTAAQLGTVEGGARTPDAILLADTGSDIAGALTTLLTDRVNLGPITITSGSVILSVAQATTAHVADGAGSLVSLLPGQSYGVSGASVGQIATLMGLAQAPATIGVSDSSASIAADIASAGSQIAAHATSLSVTGGTLTLTDAQAHGVLTNGNTAALDKMGTGQTIDITGVPVADIGTFSALAGGLAAGVTLNLEVSDTALALATDLGLGGASLLTNDAAYVHSVTLSGAGGTLYTNQLAEVADLSGLNTNGISVPVSGNAGDIAGLDAASRALAGTHVTVIDADANVANQLATLQTEYGGHLTITLTGGSPSFTQTAASFAANQPTIDAITNTGCVVVTGTAAAIAAIEPALAADAHVSAVQVSDSAANIVSNLSAIAALGGAVTVTLTDVGSISASLAQALVNQNLAHLVAGSVSVADSGAQIAAMAESGSADVTFLNAQGASLTANSNVGLVDAQALYALGGSLTTNGHTINVWDTAAHLTASGAAAALSNLTGGGFVGGIYLKTTGGTVSLTAANALALLGIAGISIDNPDGSVNTITVVDTAAHLDGNFASLQADASSIAAFVINASATVNATVLSDMQTLGATTGSGVALTLSDTADNILSAAAVNGASVQASAWNLSANASVTSANALTLAALPNFSAAGHTLTVALGADTPVGSVAQANQLGALGAALVVTGHVYTISGSVASLAGLSTAGASVAHVALSDTFTNLSGLSSGSPLLTGTIAVTDGESLTASQAQGFLALLSAAGVADGHVSFTGGAETVTDTVANLQALTGSAAWTGNAALQAHFSLVANDNAATLDNAANAAFLNTLSGQVLAATATVSAANATALHGLSNFSLGGHNLIVSDTATNLLNAANSNGLALATSIQLSGAASLNAAQAEQLLQTNHFTLTQTLNITDSSANLLDGTLQPLIAGHAQVHVALAGMETLDAETAAALVSLQGFSDTSDMNIVDSSSYLLASGASAAEAMAVSVALAGDETVSANTILRLSDIPHFIATGGTLTLAGNDYADAPTLKAIADLGTHFSEGGHSLSLTQDDLGLTPAEYAAIAADGYVANGHVVSAELTGGSVSDVSNTMALTATGVAGASVNVYDHSGTLLSSTVESNASFTVSAPDGGSGDNFSITETVGGVESAPVVVLNASTLEGLVSGASASFSNTGQIQVGTGEYVNLYTAGASLPNAPALVYDPNAHTISLDIPNASPVVLITLGASTHPSSIDPTEILVKHHA